MIKLSLERTQINPTSIYKAICFGHFKRIFKTSFGQLSITRLSNLQEESQEEGIAKDLKSEWGPPASAVIL